MNREVCLTQTFSPFSMIELMKHLIDLRYDLPHTDTEPLFGFKLDNIMCFFTWDFVFLLYVDG